jgi:hypothetical protein
MARRQIVKCDLCYVRLPPEIVWNYEIVPFAFKGEPGQQDYLDDGYWALCDTCHQLVKSQRYEKVFERSAAMDPVVYDDDASERWRRRMIGLFLNAKRRRPPYQGALFLFSDGETQHG